MSGERFPSFPPCCKKVLEELFREHKTGARNCERGHSVSLEGAAAVEARKAAAASKR